VFKLSLAKRESHATRTDFLQAAFRAGDERARAPESRGISGFPHPARRPRGKGTRLSLQLTACSRTEFVLRDARPPRRKLSVNNHESFTPRRDEKAV
jgi:hypothetical protein